MSERTYGDGCGIAHGLDLVGERWALLIVRELLLGPLRFSDLRAGLPGAGPTVLSQRLRELDRTGVVRRRELPPPAASIVYELTAHGAGLEPIVIALGSWALRSENPPAGPVSAVSAMLTLRTYFDPDDRSWSGTLGVHLGDRDYRVLIDAGRAEIAAGKAGDSDAGIDTDPDTLVAVLTGRQPPMRVDGDRTVLERVIAGMRIPPAGR
jgi:DNA-binding HxlR family transcriptional regulator